MMRVRRTFLTLGLTAGLIVAGGGVASAHECYVPNRSERGNAGASHSANWSTLEVADLFAEAHLFLGGEALTEDQIQTALVMAAEADVPLSVTVFERFTIPRSIEELDEVTDKSSDGKGIDHFFTAHIDTLAGIFFALQPA